MAEHLEPCPFCGDKAIFPEGPGAPLLIACLGCHMEFDRRKTERYDLAKLFNQRPRVEELERLNATLNSELSETQLAIVELAHAMMIDAEARWDNDSCPNNSDILREMIADAARLIELVEKAGKLIHAPLPFLQSPILEVHQAAVTEWMDAYDLVMDNA